MLGRPTTLAYGRAGACCACSRCGSGVCVCVCVCFVFFFFFFSFLLLLLFFFCFVFLISSILFSFSNASSVGRRLDILKYCGLGRSNPAVVVSYY